MPIHTTASHLAFPKQNFKINSQYRNQAFQGMPHLSATLNSWPVHPTGCKHQLIGDQEQRRRDDSHHRQLFGRLEKTLVSYAVQHDVLVDSARSSYRFRFRHIVSWLLKITDEFLTKLSHPSRYRTVGTI